MNDYESKLPRWAYCTSPLLFNNSLIVEVGGSNSRGFVSINKKTGEINWQKGHATPYYCSPAIAEIEEEINIIFANDSMLTSFDETGNELWSYRMPMRFPTATPLFIPPNKVFISSAGKKGGCLVEINNKTVNQLYTTINMKNHFGTSCYHEGFIYGFNNAMFRCISVENGEVKWTKRGLGKGTLIKVDNKFLVLSDKGVLKLVDANPDMYTELGSIQAIEGKSWTAPSVGNGIVYLRNLTEIACYNLN